MRTLILTKSVPNPAMQARPVSGELDPGRPWSGDLYDEGMVTDPAEAFAQFSGGEDTEAWLDRHEDGTLIGWVREGTDVWRYTDPQAWALDVDGAQLGRTDEATPPPADDAAAAPTDEAAPADETDLADDSLAPAEDQVADELAETPTTDAAAETAATEVPPEFDYSDDELAESGVPSDSPSEEVAAPDTPDTAEADDEDEDEFGKTEKKHMQGHHNQEDHGDWSDGITPDLDAPTSSSGSTSTTGGGPGAPKAPEPKAAALTPETLERLSDAELAAITEQPDGYTWETIYAAAEELDRRHPLGDDFAADTEPGSPERLGAFAATIPKEWIELAASGVHKPKRKKNRRDEIKAEWLDYMDSMYQMAAAALGTNGWWNKAGSGFVDKQRSNGGSITEYDLMGNLPLAQWKKYAGEELKQWFAAHGGYKTFSAWASQFYPSYAKAYRDTLNAYQSEWG